jgi:flagellar secretion chaperone FliS
MMRPRSPADRYQEIGLAARVEGATPHGLVAILYEELGAALDVLARAGHGPQAAAHQGRAASILHALASGLDPGTELGANLGAIYRQMSRRLTATRTDPSALRELRDGVTNLADAWGRIG